jgi:hypothetical protein
MVFRTSTLSAGAFMAWVHGSAATAHAPHGDGVLTSGPDAERKRLTGGTSLEVQKNSRKIREGRKSNLEHFS